MSGSEYAPPSGSAFPPVLDACCGGRSFWFDKHDMRCLYVDKRRETWKIDNRSNTETVVNPDVQADFTDLPFPDNTFAHVVFDPPHLFRNGANSRTSKMYGDLRGDWRDMLRKGFAECFRVLRPEGTLIFKWCDMDVPLREILELTTAKPMYGHRRKDHPMRTHWIAFLKPNRET